MMTTDRITVAERVIGAIQRWMYNAQAKRRAKRTAQYREELIAARNIL